MKIASIVTRMKEHVRNCTSYLEDVSNVGSWIVDEHNWKRSRSDIGVLMGIMGWEKPSYTGVPRLLKQDQEEMTMPAAMALYKTGHPFHTFQDENWAA